MSLSENKQGSALVLALMWTSVITVLVVSGLHLGSMMHTMVGAFKDYQQALYLAEGGAEQAVRILTTTETPTDFTVKPHVVVTIRQATWLDAPAGTCYRVQAQASYYQAQTTVVTNGCLDAHRVWQLHSWQELSS